jgi:tight adherence protein C
MGGLDIGAFGENLAPVLVGLAVLCAALVVALPYALPDWRGARIAQIRRERATVRAQGRAALEAGHGPDLATSPRKFFEETLKGLRGGSSVVHLREAARILRSAGFRGDRPLMLFLIAQMATPALLALLVLLWANLLAAETPEPSTQGAAVLGAALLGYYAPRLYVKNAADRRRAAVLKAWPDALDLMLICVEAGMSIEVTLQKLADEMIGHCPALGEELNLTVAELAYLQDRAQALRNLGERLGLYSMRSVAASLIQSDKHGTSLAASLRVISAEQRDARMMEAEKKAAALPPKLTVPMIIFFLPVLFIVILIPAIIKVMQMDTPF